MPRSPKPGPERRLAAEYWDDELNSQDELEQPEDDDGQSQADYYRECADAGWRVGQ